MAPMTVLLESELAALPAELHAKLSQNGFNAARLIRWSHRLRSGPTASMNVPADMPIVPAEEDYVPIPAAGSAEALAATSRGEALLRDGRVAVLVLAGGMATRMGGIVKALAQVPEVGTFLDARLAEMSALHTRYGRRPELWLMSSDATHTALTQAIADAGAPATHCFRQDLSLRLNRDGSLFRAADGAPSTYATGHGDVADALQRSGLLTRFLARGGTHVFLTNVDNLGATLDPMLLGLADIAGTPVAVEVCDKEAGDRGGIPVRIAGRMSVLEEFRLPAGFDPAQVRVFNTNTFWLRAEALAAADFEWPYFEVRKKVDGLEAVQFERLVQELSARFDTSYLRVPRDGAASRFLPVKDNDDLARRGAAIALALCSRGLLPSKA